jgi:hypothetical protein
MLTSDGRLLYWGMMGEGGLQICDTVPPGLALYFEVDDSDRATVVKATRGAAPLHVLVGDPSGACSVCQVRLDDDSPIAACRVAGAFLVISKKAVYAVDERTGGVVSSRTLPSGVHHVNGRFFRHGGTAIALGFDGDRPALAPVPQLSSKTAFPAAGLFDRPGFDGPWSLVANDRVMSTVTGESIVFPAIAPVGGLASVLRTSRDGDRIQVHRSGSAPVVVDLLLRRLEEPGILDPIRKGLISQVTLRGKFSSAGWTASGRLALLARGNRTIVVGLNAGGLHLEINPSDAQAAAVAWVRFEPIKAPEGARYKLSEAAWKDGRRVLLDSRGLVHLQSPDPALPELTLILAAQHAPAVWDSHGKVWGNTYFLGSRAQTPAKHFWLILARYAEGGA